MDYNHMHLERMSCLPVKNIVCRMSNSQKFFLKKFQFATEMKSSPLKWSYIPLIHRYVQTVGVTTVLLYTIE